MQDEKCEEGCECGAYNGGGCCMDGEMKKEFKLAMIEKKEKMLQVKLEFLKKIKELIKKIPERKK